MSYKSFLLILVILLLNQEAYSLYSNKTLLCCDEHSDPSSLSCFFKNNQPHQLQSNQRYLTGSVIGGLGNQLFIMFTTISYAIKYDLPFIFEYTRVVADRRTHWKGMYASLICFSTKRYPRWHGFIKSLSYYNEKEFYYTEIPSPTQLTLNNKFTNGLKLNGYYQSYKYFNEYKHIIFQAINIYHLQGQIYERNYNKYFNTTKHVVAMHFRIGDYTLPRMTKVYPIMPLQYYINTIQQVITDLDTPNVSTATSPTTTTNTTTTTTAIRILCVYDPKDNNRIENDYLVPLRLKFPGIEFIVVDSAMPDWHQMLLMSICRIIIIANSTFSW